MTDVAAGLCLIGSGFFAFVAGIGLLRFSDLPSRMHAATKASGAAFALMLAAYCLRMPGLETVIKSVVAMAFAFLTLPVAAHLLGRSSMIDRDAPASPHEDQGEGEADSADR